MPVIDHPVHEKVRHTTETLYAACKAAVRTPGYWIKTRKYRDDGTGMYDLVDEFIPDQMSKHCRYVDYIKDRACDGCLQVKDLEYIDKMGELK